MKKFYYGGQAVLEGVMMRGRAQATVVVRRRDGELVTRTEMLPAALYKRTVTRLPLVRGLVALWEMLILGMRMMLFSANVQAEADLGAEIPKSVIATMLTVSLTLAIAIFFVLPLLLSRADHRLIHGTIATNAAEGLVRLALFLGYIALIGRIGRMKRVFQYHGAEHKTINAFEHGAELTPESVGRYSTIHVRCGTAFLLWVVVVSIFVFALLGHPPLIVSILARVVLVPLIAAISYEILRLGARYYHLFPVRMVVQPGLWLQRLTTREPSPDQIEVAIAALQPVLQADGVFEASPHPAGPKLQPSPAPS
ncbi:MAG: DUF1385 domain-containing protein [Chloroflexota bacterium]